MEFERAIYRVYERCIEGLREEENTSAENRQFKSCLFLEILSITIALFLFVILCLLHLNFVHNPGCILNELIIQRNITSLNQDQILYINIEKKFENNKHLRFQDDDLIEDKRQLRSYSYDSYTSFINKHNTLSDHHHHKPIKHSKLNLFHYFTLTSTTISNNTGITPRKDNVTTIIDSTSKNKIEPSYDYKFSFDSALLFLPYEMIEDHSFQTINITLSGTQCFGSSFIQGIIPLGGIDTVIMNYLMYSFNEPGNILSAWPIESFYRWHWYDLQPYNSPQEWIGFKCNILFNSILSFFILSTVTALLVRVLISSGVVLLFPLFGCMQLLGYRAINLRIISLSYPWIGLPLELIRSRNQSATPFIIAHLSRVIIYYFLYQATQVLFTLWMYNHEQPGQAYIWIFVIMMLWEYYSMIYLRASGSIQLFPRASLALFLIYHIYYFSYPSGFHVLALVVLFFALLFLMIHCIRVYEIKAFDLGLVSLDQPRMLYNVLPWPAWRAALAPDFTLMMPMNMRSESAYNTNIPNITTNRATTIPHNNSDNSDNNNNIVISNTSEQIINPMIVNSSTNRSRLYESDVLGEDMDIHNNNNNNINNNNNNNNSNSLRQQIELTPIAADNNNNIGSNSTLTTVGNILKRGSTSIVQSLHSNNATTMNNNMNTNTITNTSINRGNYMRIASDYDTDKDNCDPSNSNSSNR